MSMAARFPSWVAAVVLLLATVELTRGDDDPLRGRVYAEYPLLDPNHPQHEGVSDWDTVRMLREFSYRHTSYTNYVEPSSHGLPCRRDGWKTAQRFRCVLECRRELPMV